MKIHSLHNEVQEICDKPENFDLNEDFFGVKLDKMRNRFKQVSDNLK